MIGVTYKIQKLILKKNKPRHFEAIKHQWSNKSYFV